MISASSPAITKKMPAVMKYWIPMTLASIEKMYLRMKLVGSGWMWSRTAWYGPVFTPGASVALWWWSPLLLREADEVGHQVRDVGVRDLVDLRAGHDAHVTLVAVVDDRRDVLRRHGRTVHELGMGGVAEDLAQARADLLLIERPGGVARAALLAEQRLASGGLALIDRDRGAPRCAAASARGRA